MLFSLHNYKKRKTTIIEYLYNNSPQRNKLWKPMDRYGLLVRVWGCQFWYYSDDSLLVFDVLWVWKSRPAFRSKCCNLLQIWQKNVNLDAAVPQSLHGLIPRIMKLDEALSSETSILTHESMRCQNAVDYHLQVLVTVKIWDFWIHGEIRRITNIHFLIGIYAQPWTDSMLCIYGT